MVFRDIMDLIDKLIFPLLGWIAYEIRQVSNQLRTINGRIATIEQWSKDHDIIDTDRHAENRGRLVILERMMYGKLRRNED